MLSQPYECRKIVNLLLKTHSTCITDQQKAAWMHVTVIKLTKQNIATSDKTKFVRYATTPGCRSTICPAPNPLPVNFVRCCLKPDMLHTGDLHCCIMGNVAALNLSILPWQPHVNTACEIMIVEHCLRP